jgi:hypothetical protein
MRLLRPIQNVKVQVRSRHRLVRWGRHGTVDDVNNFAFKWNSGTYLFISDTMLLHNLKLEEFLRMRTSPVVVKLLLCEILLSLGKDEQLDRYSRMRHCELQLYLIRIVENERSRGKNSIDC